MTSKLDSLRALRIDGDVAYVPLSRGLEAVIDAADVHLVAGMKWSAIPRGRTFYAVAKTKDRRNCKMHRVIMNSPAGLEIDHMDGNGLNNRRDNLRAATKNQNQHNARMRSDNSSGAKGVHWHKGKQKWEAQIMLNGKRVWSKRFAERADAESARAAKVLELHGDFGRMA